MTTKTFINKLKESITNEGQILINDFFVTFSRFECALKASGFINGSDDRVSANWETFVASIRDDFDNAQKTSQIHFAVEYLINHPPKIQNYSNNQLGWRDRTFEDNLPLINKLCLSIKDIRNNLFHGGKFNGNFEEEVSRNFILLNSAIEILNHWLQLSQTVRQNFLAPIS